MASDYLLHQTKKSFCQKCGKPVHSLMNKNLRGPKFYICFECKFVGQIGKGRVMYERE